MRRQVRPGDGTNAPQTVTIRGPQGSGANVQPGDLIIRAGGGTGSWGSGKIRFQNAQANTPYPIYVTAVLASATTSATRYVLIPNGFQNVLVMLCISTKTSTDTVTSMTLNGTNFTSAYQITSATSGFIKYAYLVNPTSGTLTVTFGASTTGFVQIIVFENANLVADGSSQSTASGALVSASVSNISEGDLIFDNCIQINASPQIETYSYSNMQSLVESYTILTTGQITSTLTAPTTIGSATVSRSSVTNVPALLAAVRVQMYRNPSSTTSATFTDLLILNSTGKIYYPFSKPDTMFEFTDFSSTLIKFLTPSSARFQIVRNQSISFSKTIVLPRADQLPIGTKFCINGQPCGNNCYVYIIPRYGGIGFSANSDYDLTASATQYAGAMLDVTTTYCIGSIGNRYCRVTGVQTNTNAVLATCELVSNEGSGMWLTWVSSDNSFM